jgi:hypothetical protein
VASRWDSDKTDLVVSQIKTIVEAAIKSQFPGLTEILNRPLRYSPSLRIEVYRQLDQTPETNAFVVYYAKSLQKFSASLTITDELWDSFIDLQHATDAITIRLCEAIEGLDDYVTEQGEPRLLKNSASR